ncbi:hypothetical protein HZH68_001689 [Vespula germanica]|uniref:Uncharacterized protein n=1 Tax=Vespula germanica TaxID=30212 RepID=A0A834NVX9_VESGE|nr:hypothetical protein HZH68_001689 [Vespula germanica]
MKGEGDGGDGGGSDGGSGGGSGGQLSPQAIIVIKQKWTILAANSVHGAATTARKAAKNSAVIESILCKPISEQPTPSLFSSSSFFSLATDLRSPICRQRKVLSTLPPPPLALLPPPTPPSSLLPLHPPLGPPPASLSIRE